MFNPSLDTLARLVTGPFQVSRPQFELALARHLEDALGSIVSNDYVEDCLDLITLSIDRLLSADDGERDMARLHMLGALEALRDELALCDRQAMSSLRAVGM